MLVLDGMGRVKGNPNWTSSQEVVKQPIMEQWIAINHQLICIFVFNYWPSFKASFKRQNWGIRKGFARLKLYPETKHEFWDMVRLKWDSWGLNWERAKEALGVGRIPIAKVQAKEFRLGEFYHVSVIILINCMRCDLNMHEFFLLYVEFCVSGKFLETAWRAIYSRQATQASLVYFWVPWGIAWRWIPIPPGDINLQPSFWVLWWTCWQWWTPVKRRESNWLGFNVLCVLGWFWSGKNEVLLDYWWCDVLYCRIIYGWRLNVGVFLLLIWEWILWISIGNYWSMWLGYGLFWMWMKSGGDW